MGENTPDHFEAIPEAWLDVLDDSIKHRGTDGCGRFRQRITRSDGTIVDVALVHRRLSIIDLEDGIQPMVISTLHNETGISPAKTESALTTASFDALSAPLISRDGSVYQPCTNDTNHHTCPRCSPGVLAVVFNGCIYNHRPLRAELEQLGHVFFSNHSDTEALLHAYRQWGENLHEHLNSMHTFAIWDAAAGQLVLGRDAFGEKPLYSGWINDDMMFGFCSNGLGLAKLVNEGEDLKLDAGAMVEWIRMGYDAELSPFDSTLQIGHGETLSLIPGQTAQRKLTRDNHHAGMSRIGLAIGSKPNQLSSREAQKQVDALLANALASRLEADVPLGCLLSGGVDSSLIAYHAQQQLEDQLTTICVRMPDNRYDESTYAQLAADRIGSKHIVVDAHTNPADDLKLLIQTLGLPFGDSSLLPTWWACKAAAHEVKVLLSGDGGDELFLGYERYKAVQSVSLLKGLHLPWGYHLCANALPKRHPKSRWSKAARLLEACDIGWSVAYRELLSIFPTRDLQHLLHVDSDVQPVNTSQVGSIVSARAYDLVNHLPGDMLRKVDTASMLAGVEVRLPFLDPTLSHFAMSLSEQQLMPRGQRKGLLRAIARQYLPVDIIDRPKMGFAIPIGEWFRNDYGQMRQLLYDHLHAKDPFPGLAGAGIEINMAFVHRMLDEHDDAGEQSCNPWHGRDHSQRLYMLLVLSIWCWWLLG